MNWLLLTTLTLLGVLTAAWRRWDPRAGADPSRDPGARRVTGAQKAQLSALLAAGGEPLALVEQGITLCAVSGRLWWRAGLRQLDPWLQSLPDDEEGRSLKALLHARLGDLEGARTLLEQIPVDHWRGCLARSVLYEVTLDLERAESALVAASQLAPAARRAGLVEQLQLFRRWARLGPSLHQQLWERAPDEA